MHYGNALTVYFDVPLCTISPEFVIINHQEIVQVLSDDGECMQLCRPISLQKSVEHWLSRLQESVAETIRMDIYSCIKDIDNGLPLEELVSKVFRKKI